MTASIRSRALAVAFVACLAASCSKSPADKPAAPPGNPAAAPPSKPPLPPLPDPNATAPECKIEVLAKGEGREVKKGDDVLAHVAVQLADSGAVLSDTRREGDPQPLLVGASHLPALDQCLVKMRVGDHWKVRAPYQLAWGEHGVPGRVGPKADAVLDIEVVGFVELKTEVLATGHGSTPVVGESVLVTYVGSFSDGKQFVDTRKDDSPVLVRVGEGKLIRGWDMTLRNMKIGDRWKISVPWQLAYGARGNVRAIPSIPPKADLVFDLERLPLPVIKTEVVTAGAGAAVRPGTHVKVHYVETLADGTKIESSRDRGEPYEVVPGTHQVITGWDMALVQMRVGDRRRVVIPWQLAYGAQGQAPTIPKKADLHFDIEVLDVK